MKVRITYKISNSIVGERNLNLKKLVDLIRLVYTNNNLISYVVVNAGEDKK
jgi:hypothetical protein